MERTSSQNWFWPEWICSVFPLQSAKGREFGELWQEKCISRAPWTFSFNLARTSSFRPARLDNKKWPTVNSTDCCIHSIRPGLNLSCAKLDMLNFNSRDILQLEKEYTMIWHACGQYKCRSGFRVEPVQPSNVTGSKVRAPHRFSERWQHTVCDTVLCFGVVNVQIIHIQ